MNNIPKDTTLDSSASLLMEGFPFIQNRSNRYKSDIFETRLLGQKVICLHGEEGAALFYDTTKFKRQGAVPKRIQRTLMGENAIQTMDGEAHKHRKAMFMSLMTPGNMHGLLEQVSVYMQAYISGKWEKLEQVVLFEDMQEILCLAACAWAGVPLKPEEVRTRARDFTAMVDAFGGVGPRYWRGRSARRRTEKWIAGLVLEVRKGKLKPAAGTALHDISWHKDLKGKRLNKHMAAIEVINVLRPTVAISWYCTFAAHALHLHPHYKEELLWHQNDFAELFVQEVRRYYPFGPFLGARVRKPFSWHGYEFEKNTLVLLDVYGTLHNPELWENPEEFRPERFREWKKSPFDFIPQGGGDHYTGHRCAGEWITIETTKLVVQFLAAYINYEVPEQDLSFSLTRMPTYPTSGFVMQGVTRTGRAAPVYEAPVARCPYHH